MLKLILHLFYTIILDVRTDRGRYKIVVLKEALEMNFFFVQIMLLQGIRLKAFRKDIWSAVREVCENAKICFSRNCILVVIFAFMASALRRK